MDDKKGFSYAFGMCRFSLRLLGLWPYSKSVKYGKAISLVSLILINLIIVVFDTVAQTVKLVMVWGDLDQITNNISTANLPIAVSVFKMIFFYNHIKALESLISFVKTDWDGFKTKRDKKNMWSNASMAHKMSWLCAILGIGTVNGHMTIRLCQELGILPGPPEGRLPFVDSYFPFNHRNTPVYEIIWLLQYTGAATATIAYSGIYSLFVALMLHVCGQFANLRDRLENVVLRKEDTRTFQKKLADIVERHESLNRFAHVIERIFNPMFLAEIFSCTIQFCLQGFLLVTLTSSKGAGVPILQLLFRLVFVTQVGTHLFICCYVAERLQEESTSMSDAAYNCDWCDLSPKNAMMLLIVMQRARTPLQVTAGKFCIFSLSLYAQIFKTSGGYLSMLLAVRDRIS